MSQAEAAPHPPASGAPATGCPYAGTGAAMPDPCRDYLGLRDAEPVRRDEDLELWIVTGFREATALLRHPALSSAWPEHGTTLLHPTADDARTAELVRRWFMFTDDPAHARARRLVAPLLAAERVAALRPFVEEQVRDLLAPHGDALDVVQDLAVPLSGRVICRILGLPPAVAPALEPWAVDVAALLVADYLPEVVTRGHTALQDMTRLVDHALDGELAPDTGLSLLRAARDRGEVTTQDVWATAGFLVYAGFETTSTFIAKAVRALLHTGSWDRLRALGAASAVEELLRFDTSVQQVARVATAPVEVAGRTIPAGDLVLVMLGAANRDPAVFDQPDTLDPDRRISRHLGFGHGAHYCLGAGLARIEATAALDGLLTRWESPRLVAPPGIRHHAGLTLLDHLRVAEGAAGCAHP